MRRPVDRVDGVLCRREDMRVGHDHRLLDRSRGGRPGPEERVGGLVVDGEAAVVHGVDAPPRDARLAGEVVLQLPSDRAGRRVEADEAAVVDREDVPVRAEDRRGLHAPAVPLEIRVGDEAVRPVRAVDELLDVEPGHVVAHIGEGARPVDCRRPLVVLWELREPELITLRPVEPVHSAEGSTVDVDPAVVDGRREISLPLRPVRRLEDRRSSCRRSRRGPRARYRCRR